jgi:septal ring factor EnvC (AmiA/AmiB activator)
LLLEGDSPARLARDSEYLAYISRASTDALDQLRERRAELQELEAQSRAKRDELARIESEEAAGRRDLQQEQARRSRTLESVGKQIAAQRTSITKLERDEKRLGGLIDQLGRVIAEQAKRDAERARLAAAKKAAAPPTKAVPAPSAPPDSNEPSSFTGNFALLKGKMILPTAGSIEARFGAQRRTEAGATGPTWKGIFIRAPTGAEIRAVGAGRVVFADWLRGFGNLLIIDHGDGYLSVYGNNEALLRNTGDEVAVGETIASVGNTGGNEHPGLYFELRFRGRPFDPLTWTAAR